jgi:transcriptional regulator with XRE-family HTH domain
MAYTARALCAARVAAGLSVEQVAGLICPSTANALAIIEDGTVLPTVAIITELASVYGVAPESLYDKGNPADPVVVFDGQVSAVVDRMRPLSAERRSRLQVLLRGVA